ncbi:MAG: RimJ/RimL family protein N-acetyltransferase [Candidatus Azotimanducaceae bacterium]
MSQRPILKYWIETLTGEEAGQILSWRYQPPYDFYNPPQQESHEPIVKEFLKPANGFHGIRDDQHRFVGFCSFGHDGRVLGGRYEDDAMDIGLGMKPQFTSQGRGSEFFEAIVQHATNELEAEQLRLTVADFNTRAIRIYARLGFEVKDHFVDFLSSEPHTIMVRS